LLQLKPDTRYKGAAMAATDRTFLPSSEGAIEIGAPPRTVGHSTNLVGLPTDFLASCDFNAEPRPVHIFGVREMNPTLFEMLGLAESLIEACEAFDHYMKAVFGLAPDPREPVRRAGIAGRRYRASYLDVIRGWGFDSNGAEGAVLKGWVESRFGIFPTYHKEPICQISTGAWTGYVEEKMGSRFHSNSIYTQFDLVYEFCCWAAPQLHRGVTHVTLFRGINSFEEHRVAKRLDRNHVVIRLNNLVSFSRDRDVASCFGDTILTVDVPLQKLLFFTSLLPNHGLKGEAEYLVIGGDYLVETSTL
jgi:NAD+---dinitrogen-reductase ADP-D-ribosyltransferase